MKIVNIKSEKYANRARVSANVIWEDCGRPKQEIFFETHEKYSTDLSPNPHAFVVACIMPAMRFREERIHIDAEICPELKDGLKVAMSWIRHWFCNYRKDDKLVLIEAKTPRCQPLHARPPRAGFFFSGGVDSTATLLNNRLNYPLDHHRSIKDALLVYGLEINEPEKFEYVLHSVSVLANDAKLSLIPVFTNIRDLGPENNIDFWQDFWVKEFMGAAFAAVAHAFSNRLTLAYIAATDDIPGLALIKKQCPTPFSTHPLIDPNYSSADLQIKHDGMCLSRLDKTRLVAEWDLALRHLRVCNCVKSYKPDLFNCGKCEKCIRTMLALLVVNALDKTTTFAEHDVSEENLQKIKIAKPITKGGYSGERYYLELIPYLIQKGRYDLAHGIKRLIWRSHHSWMNPKKKIKQLDKYITKAVSKFSNVILHQGAMEKITRA
jgi:hypothetical protein